MLLLCRPLKLFTIAIFSFPLLNGCRVDNDHADNAHQNTGYVDASNAVHFQEIDRVPIGGKGAITRLDLPDKSNSLRRKSTGVNNGRSATARIRATMALNESGITLNGNKTLYLQTGKLYRELGAFAMGNRANDITRDIEIKHNLRLNDSGLIAQTGTFAVDYRVIDNSQSPTTEFATSRRIVVRQASCSEQDDRNCLKLAENHSQKISDFPNGRNISGGVKIRASRTTCTAPCGIHFEARLSNSFWSEENTSLISAFNEVAYHWDFGDETAEFISLHSDFRFSRSSNYAQGPYAAHVFSRAGSYEVRIKIADKTGRASESVIDVVVETPESQYPRDRTLCVANNNQFQGCPTHARRINEWDELARIINHRPRLERRLGYRVLFRAGQDFHATQTLHLRDGPYLFNRFGSGVNPDIFITQDMDIFYPMKTRDVTIANIDAKGTYDPTTGYGDTYQSHFIKTSLVNDLTVYRTHSAGFGMHAFLTGGDALIIADNTTTDWHDYGSLCNAYDVNRNGRLDRDEFTHRVAYIGNRFRQNPAAVSGPGGKNGQFPHWADHGPIRTAGSFKMVVSQNDLASTTGWSSDGQGHQPALRYNQSGPAKHSAVINQNQLEGGYHVVALATQNPNTRAYLGNILFERNFLLASANTMYMIRLNYGNSIIRNNMAVMPDINDDGLLLPFTHMIELGFGSSSQANMRAEKHIFGNTFLNLQSSSSVDFRPFGNSFMNLTPQNKYKASRNIIYSINQADAVTTDILDITPRNIHEYFPSNKNNEMRYPFHQKGLFDTYNGFKRDE